MGTKRKREVNVNLNDLAKELCEKETGKAEINIAQMKEILKVVSIKLFACHETLLSVLQYGRKKLHKEEN